METVSDKEKYIDVVDGDRIFINREAGNLKDLSDYDLACFIFGYNDGGRFLQFLQDATMVHNLKKLTEPEKAELIRRMYLVYQNASRLISEYNRK